MRFREEGSVDYPGEKVLIRLVDLIETGVGGYLRPWQIRRVAGANADARRIERLRLEQTEIDIAEIRAGRKGFDASGKLVALEARPPLLLEGPGAADATSAEAAAEFVEGFAAAARDTAEADGLQRAVNLKRIVLFAEEDAEKIDRQTDAPGPAEGSPPEVDPDWFWRWRTGAQEVSREEMQRLWASLLAGEVARPGTYSLHTVDFLSRLSKPDADLIARVAPFITSSGIVKPGSDFLAGKGFRFEDFLYLEEIGIINGAAGTLSFNLGGWDDSGRTVADLACNGTVLRFDMGETARSPAKLTFGAMMITKIGREILSLASFAADEDYLRGIADMAIEKGAHRVLRGRLHADGRQILDLRPMATTGPDPRA